MADKTITQDSGTVLTYADDLADGSTLELRGTDSQTGSAEISSVIHGADCDIAFVIEDDGGSQIVTVDIKSPTGASMYPLPAPLPASENDNSYVEVTNTSGSASDFAIEGYEVE